MNSCGAGRIGELRRKRNFLEINAEILRIALHVAKKTHVVYQANLNFKILQEYLDKMSGAGLITYKNGEIKTTDKGVAYLRQYSDFIKLVEVYPVT